MTTETATDVNTERVQIWNARCRHCGRWCRVTKIVYALAVTQITPKEGTPFIMRERTHFDRAEGICSRCGPVEDVDCAFDWVEA